jgi:hypothetical protein
MAFIYPGIGDFAVIPISGNVGKLISFGEWLNGDGFGAYDHAEIYVGMADANAPLGYTMGAYPGGATLVPVPQDQTGWLWSTGHINLTDDQRSKIVQNALACKGIPYSGLDYFALATHRLHVPAPFLKTYIASTKHLICSQLVDLCYDNAGVHLFNDNRWPGYVTPADLANVILHPEQVVYA